MGSSFFALVVLPVRFIGKCAALFFENKITQASAALSYYLTMTFFPLLIIAYSLLGKGYEGIAQLVELAEHLLSEAVIGFIREFLLYIDSGDSSLMLPVGLTVLVAYASAGIRSVQSTIGGIQGGAEYKGLGAYIFSFVYCFALLALSYFAMIIMLSGPALMRWIISLFPGMEKFAALLPLRYVLLAGVLFLFLLGLYHVPKRKQDKYSVLPGAAVVSAAVLIVSPLFSAIMSRSMKYSLVYGSIASLILLMLWLYMCCVLLYSGAIFNVALYEVRKEKKIFRKLKHSSG